MIFVTRYGVRVRVCKPALQCKPGFPEPNSRSVITPVPDWVHPYLLKQENILTLARRAGLDSSALYKLRAGKRKYISLYVLDKLCIHTGRQLPDAPWYVIAGGENGTGGGVVPLLTEELVEQERAG